MKEEEDKIDHKFKEGLSNAEDNIAFRNADWDAMEKLLDEEKRRRGFIYRLPAIITGIAALLLLTLGFFFLRPATNNNDATKNNVARIKPSTTTNNNTIDKTSTSNNPSNGNNIDNKPAMASNKPANENADTATNNSAVSSNSSKDKATLAGVKSATEIAGVPNKNTDSGNHSKAKSGLGNQQPPINGNVSQLAATGNRKHNNNTGNINSAITGTSTDNTEIAAISTNKGTINTANKNGLNKNMPTDLSASGTSVLNDNALQSLNIASLNATDKQLDKNSRSYAAAVIAKQKKKNASFNSFGPTHALVLSILTAPDFNGVGGSFSNTQVGSTSGLMLSFGLTHRLTVSTGAMYAKKPYSANFSQYTTNYPFKVQPTNVYADCRVLDIPLNIDYRLYSKGRNMIAVGTGISSYFMLRENYRFDYDNNPGWASTNFDIKNQNQHILGVLNLSATYQRRMNEKFGINVQPYMKLPLTSIGYGKVDLQSTGVAVGVSWYLSSNHPK